MTPLIFGRPDRKGSTNRNNRISGVQQLHAPGTWPPACLKSRADKSGDAEPVLQRELAGVRADQKRVVQAYAALYKQARFIA